MTAEALRTQRIAEGSSSRIVSARTLRALRLCGEFLFFFFFFFVGACASPRPEPVRYDATRVVVEGRVVDGDGEPLAGVTVLADESPKTRTDASGGYRLVLSRDARLAKTIGFQLQGYVTARVDLELVPADVVLKKS